MDRLEQAIRSLAEHDNMSRDDFVAQIATLRKHVANLEREHKQRTDSLKRLIDMWIKVGTEKFRNPG